MSSPRTPFGGENYAGRNCIGVDPDLFHPVQSDSPDLTERAKAVCRGCVVQAECLEYALVNVERVGVWGGTSEKERRRLRQRRARSAILASEAS